jgi:hypothetical protein
MFVVCAQVGRDPAFTALCYPGFLPGNAFGFNAAGVMHTIDAVSPRQVRVGLGRHFVARSLFDASSLDDAIRRASVPGRASGFTYNVGSLAERRVVSVEVAPDRHHVHEVKDYYVHTNHYLELDGAPQSIGLSSRRRLARARALCQANPPAGAEQVLSLLGDLTGGDYPIYRSAAPPDRSFTLCSALFDLDARQLHIYPGHPEHQAAQCITFDM